jgi:hypothetical protein
VLIGNGGDIEFSDFGESSDGFFSIGNSDLLPSRPKYSPAEMRLESYTARTMLWVGQICSSSSFIRAFLFTAQAFGQSRAFINP